MHLLVSSALGADGDGYSAVLAFDREGALMGAFSDDARVLDPRGMAVDPTERLLFVNGGNDRILALDRDGNVIRDTGPIPQLNPGGGVLGPGGRYYVGLRGARTIMAFSPTLDGAGEHILPDRIVPFARGFGFGADGRLFLSSGIGPEGEGDNSIVVFAPGRYAKPSLLVSDPALSPLDLTVAPNGNIVVSSEHPFGAQDAKTSVREYDATEGRLIRVFAVSGAAAFRRPRGLRFGPDGTLYCVAQDEVMAFDFASGQCIGPVVQLPRLNGQAIAFFP